MQTVHNAHGCTNVRCDRQRGCRRELVRMGHMPVETENEVSYGKAGRRHPSPLSRLVICQALPKLEGWPDTPQQAAALNAGHAVAEGPPPPHGRPHQATPNLKAVLLQPPLVLRCQDLHQHCRQKPVACTTHLQTVDQKNPASVPDVSSAIQVRPYVLHSQHVEN